MSDLRALLKEPWCPIIEQFERVGQCYASDVPNVAQDARPPLATRLPECVPPGMEWEPTDCQWSLSDDPHFGYITDEQAELLFIGKAVKVLGQAGWHLEYWHDEWQVFNDARERVASSTAPESALAASLHKLADECKQETTS